MRTPGLATAVALILLAGHATAARRQPPKLPTGAASADALVARLRDLPLPLSSSSAVVAAKPSAPHSLPDLELRRQRTYDALHALGPAGVTALARALRDPDPQMRRNVAVALDVVGGGWWHFPDGRRGLDLRPALPALLAALQDSDPGVRAWAAQDLSDMGANAAAAVPPLRAMLRRPDPESRGNACRALGKIGAAAAGVLPDLEHALGDSSPEVRQAAREAVARIERAEALR